MTAFDRAWDVVKMPYFIKPEVEGSEREDVDFDGDGWRGAEGEYLGPHDVLYQGSKMGDPDTNHWTHDKNIALLYAIHGSDQSRTAEKREGEPQLRATLPTTEDVWLEPDYQHSRAGYAPEGLESEIVPMDDEINELIRQLTIRPHDEYGDTVPKTWFSGAPEGDAG